MDSIQERIRAYERGIIGDAELVELIEQEADGDIREREEEEELEQEILNEA